MSVEMKGIRPIVEGAEKPANGGYDNTAFQNDQPNHAEEYCVDTGDIDTKMAAELAEEEDDYEYNAYQRGLLALQDGISKFFTRHKTVIWTTVGIILLLAYFVYLGLALHYKFGDEGSWRLLGFTIFGVLLLVGIKLYNAYETQIDKWWESTSDARNSRAVDKCGTFVSWFLRVGVFVAVTAYVIIDIAIDHPDNLISVAGMCLYIIIFYITSINPARVNWHTVFWGIALQYVFALLILRTVWGYEMFKWLGDRVTEFLEYTMAGVLFVFGDKFYDHFFAMKVLSIVTFFFTFINIMYYLGVMQAIIKVLGRFLAFCMGTTPAESINAAANIFVSMVDGPMLIKDSLPEMTNSELHAIMTNGFATIAGSVLGAYINFGIDGPMLIRHTLPNMTKSELHAIMTNGFATIAGGVLGAYINFGTESPLMIRPFLADMTRSELHAVMTGGFATIAGSVLGAYISFGVPANHLLSASVMSAPAALAMSKLSYPEVQKSKASNKDFAKMEKAPEHNIIEAASNGASASVKIIGAIAVNVLAFLSLLAFLNATLRWFGDRVGIENFTFEFICSYVLYPVSYFMGVETDDCRKVAELVGVKTFTNEFIAYGNLKVLIQNRKDLMNYTDFYNTTDWFWEKGNIFLNQTGQVLLGGVISEKSEIITTYALCGFANFGSIGITLGGLGTLAPTRKSDLSQMVLRAMICGNAACFLTACIAGLLYKPF